MEAYAPRDHQLEMNPPHLSDKATIQLQKLDEEVQDVSRKVQQQLSLVQEHTAEYNSLEIQRGQVENKKQQLAGSWRGWLVSVIDKAGGAISKALHSTGLFSDYDHALEEYGQEIARLKKRSDEESSDILAHRATMQSLLETQKILENECKFLVVRENVYALFGGQEKFEALPIIETSTLREKYEAKGNASINFIHPEDMTQDIMRGEDRGRTFFAVREGKNVQVFFEKVGEKSVSWSHGAVMGMERMVDIGNFWINDGNIQMEAYNKINALIHRVIARMAPTSPKMMPKPVPKQVYNFFGGLEKFNALPMLNTELLRNKYNSQGDDIDFIRAEDMTAPIMRGEDRGRPFFAIKENERVQAFFQQEADSPETWADGASSGSIIFCPPEWIENGKVEEDVGEELRAFITKVRSA